MRVPDVVLKSVAFIGEAREIEAEVVLGDLLATGFFVSVASTHPKLVHRIHMYFVTAGHVARALSDKPVYFLVNKRGGGVTGMGIGTNCNWLPHPTDRTVDLAVLPVDYQEDADIKSVPARDFVSATDIASQSVGIGDEVFITGLFTAAPGTERIMPLVRHGNIAMLPQEQIQTEMGYADVYLLEARSIGGISGSPVFVRPTVMVPTEEATLYGVGPMKLLGLVQSHWDVKESEINKPSVIHDRKRGVNYGVAVVVPASKILETINQPVLTEARMASDDRYSRKSIPGTDMAKPKRDEEFTKQDFEDALKRASRKLNPDEK